jgi:S1-C subfamily serine protease
LAHAALQRCIKGLVMARTPYPRHHQNPTDRLRRLIRPAFASLGIALALGLAACASNSTTPAIADARSETNSRATSAEQEALAIALQRASDATVGLLIRAVPGARSAPTLGAQRIGSGVVIGADGLVLTIGYLILEAQDIVLELDDGRHIPARAVGYDQATGFGLVQALAPIGIEPVPLGSADAVGATDPLLIVSGGRAGHAGLLSQARLEHKREFAGYWEYHIRTALFTSPPRQDHSGAGLFNRKGELVGIGSLLMSDVAANPEATPSDSRKPGNMFVPVDLLKPVLAELRASGSTRASRRAWLGLNCNERDGQLVVLRVTGDGPADAAGLQPGDVITALDGRSVHDLAGFYRRLWNEGPAEREILLDVARQGETGQQIVLHSVDRATTLRRADGI